MMPAASAVGAAGVGGGAGGGDRKRRAEHPGELASRAPPSAAVAALEATPAVPALLRSISDPGAAAGTHVSLAQLRAQWARQPTSSLAVPSVVSGDPQPTRSAWRGVAHAGPTSPVPRAVPGEQRSVTPPPSPGSRVAGLGADVAALQLTARIGVSESRLSATIAAAVASGDLQGSDNDGVPADDSTETKEPSDDKPAPEAPLAGDAVGGAVAAEPMPKAKAASAGSEAPAPPEFVADESLRGTPPASPTVGYAHAVPVSGYAAPSHGAGHYSVHGDGRAGGSSLATSVAAAAPTATNEGAATPYMQYQVLTTDASGATWAHAAAPLPAGGAYHPHSPFACGWSCPQHAPPATASYGAAAATGVWPAPSIMMVASGPPGSVIPGHPAGYVYGGGYAPVGYTAEAAHFAALQAAHARHAETWYGAPHAGWYSHVPFEAAPTSTAGAAAPVVFDPTVAAALNRLVRHGVIPAGSLDRICLEALASVPPAVAIMALDRLAEKDLSGVRNLSKYFGRIIRVVGLADADGPSMPEWLPQSVSDCVATLIRDGVLPADRPFDSAAWELLGRMTPGQAIRALEQLGAAHRKESLRNPCAYFSGIARAYLATPVREHHDRLHAGDRSRSRAGARGPSGPSRSRRGSRDTGAAAEHGGAGDSDDASSLPMATAASAALDAAWPALGSSQSRASSRRSSGSTTETKGGE